MFRFKKKKRVETETDAAPKAGEQSGLTTYLLQFLRRRVWLMLFVFVLGSAATAFYTYVCVPEYKASTKIFVQSSTDQQILLFNDLNRPVLRGMNIIPANNIIEMATSELHARTIVDEFRIDEELRRRMEQPEGFREEFWAGVAQVKRSLKRAIKYPIVWYRQTFKGETPVESRPNYRNQAIRRFMKDMTDIELVAESDVIKLSIWWVKPGETEQIVKRLANLVIAQFVQLQQEAARSGYEFCRAELAKARAELTAAEDRLQAFRVRNRIGELDKERAAALAQLHEMDKNLTTANAELAGMRAKLAESEKQLLEERQMLTSVKSYQTLQEDLVSMRIDIAQLQAKRGEYDGARRAAAAELARLSGLDTDLQRMQREVDLKEKLVVQLGSKEDELAVQRVSDLSGFNLRIIDTPARGEDTPAAWPDWTLNLCIGIPASLLIAVGLALLLHLWSDPFWTRLNVQEKD